MPSFIQSNGEIKIPAAWLIEQSGLKGFRQQGVGVSDNHALVLINYNSPHGQAVLDLAQHIQQAVQDKFGVLIEPEVRIY